MNRSSIIDPQIARLLDDRPADGIFRVHPDAFTDRDIFELELAQIFERTWVFLGLEAEVAAPHDYVTRRIGRRGVILTLSEQLPSPRHAIVSARSRQSQNPRLPLPRLVVRFGRAEHRCDAAR